MWLSKDVFWVGQHIGDLNGAYPQAAPARLKSPPDWNYKGLVIFNVFRREAVSRRGIVASLCLAEDLEPYPPRTGVLPLDQRIQYRLKLKGRAAYDFEHIRGGGLLLSRLR